MVKRLIKIAALVLAAAVITVELFDMVSGSVSPRNPVSLVSGFEGWFARFRASDLGRHDYELIDVYEYKFDEENPTAVYSGVSEGEGVVFSFTDIKNFLAYRLDYDPDLNPTGNGTFEGSFETNINSKDTSEAVVAEFGTDTAYEFSFGLIDIYGAYGIEEEIPDSTSLKLKVYQIERRW